MKEQLERLSTIWKTKRPGFEKRLRAGASSAALAKFKKALGLKVPRELLALYAWHDGARNPQGDQLEGAFGWLSLKDVLATKKMLDTMGFEDEGVYPKYAWSKAWVPFLDTNGDTVCLDTRSGIVFMRYNAQTQVVLLAPSFGAWLAAHIAITEAVPTLSGESDEETWQRGYDAFNGATAKRIRKKLSPGYPKTLKNAKSLC